MRTDGDEEETPLEQVVAGVVIGAILLTAFTLLALDVAWFWVVFPVGFAGLLPAALGLVKLYERRRARRRERDAPSAAEAALATLRDRYARGELTEAEFEEKVDRLLRTESVAEASEYVREARARREPEGGTARDGRTEPDGETDRSTETERAE